MTKKSMWQIKSIFQFGLLKFIRVVVYLYFPVLRKPPKMAAIPIAQLSDINLDFSKPFWADHIYIHEQEWRKKHIVSDNVVTTLYIGKNKVTPRYSSPLTAELFKQHAEYINYFFPAFICLIEHEGQIVGYQTKFGTEMLHNKVVHKFANAHRQKLIQFMRASNYYYYDLKPANLILIDGQLSLIDLDSFWPIKNGKNRFADTMLDLDWYINEVKEIAKRR